MDDYTKKYQFPAAIFIIMICLGYIFSTLWIKPVNDQTAAILGVIMLLLTFYWGSSKGSKDQTDQKNKLEEKRMDIGGTTTTNVSSPIQPKGPFG